MTVSARGGGGGEGGAPAGGFSVNLEAVPTISRGGRRFQVLFDPETLPGAGVSLAVYAYDPDVQGPAHAHAVETEVYFCLEGSGTVRLGDRVFELTPGTAVHIPPGLEHQTRSSAKEGLRFAAFFSPGLVLGP